MSRNSSIRTLRDALGWAEEQSPERRWGSRRMEIDRLLAYVLGIPTHEIYLSPDRPLSREESDDFRSAWLRRLSGVPLQHLLGEVEFFSLGFRVAPGVFIPRPETECLVEEVIRECSGEGETWVDLGTGAGVIAVSLAVSVPGLAVVATDVSPRALRLARENARRHHVEPRIRFVRCDLLSAFREGGWADGIVSNPPYVALSEMETLPPEVRDHDPHAALLGGRDGLTPIRRLIDAAPGVLRSGGRLAFEMGESQADDVRSLLRHGSCWEDVRVLNDLADRPRIALATRACP